MPSPAAARWLILPAMAWACGPKSTGSSSVSARLGSIRGAREERPDERRAKAGRIGHQRIDMGILRPAQLGKGEGRPVKKRRRIGAARMRRGKHENASAGRLAG